MGTNVTRRDFVRLATDALWALPTVVGGVLATAPTEALADETPQSEVSGGSVDAGAPNATIIVLEPSQVGFYVVDMGDSKKTPVAGAHVRIVSRYNNAVAEGDTDDLGMLALDISALTENPDNEVVPKEYCCNATLEVSKPGYRNFKTGILRLQGAKGHYIPTRQLLPGMPYPELVTFDEWDALYTQNTFNIGVMNTMTHTMHIRILNIGEDEDSRIMLFDKTSQRVLHEIEDFSDGGVLEGGFRYEFLRMGGPNALAADMELAIRFECRGDLYEFPLALQLEEAVFDEPTEVKDIIAKPLDTYYTEGVEVGVSNNLLLPDDLPLCGGVFQMWLPEFPVSIYCDPSGYVQLTMKSPSFGYKNDFGKSEDNGWQCFPRQSAKEQCEELVSGWQKALSETSAASSRASGVLSHAKFSPKLTATANLQFMAIANWNMEKKYFQGDAVFQVLLSMTISLTEQFFAGPIPMYINFTFVGQAMANYGAGFTVPLPEGDKHPNLVHVITAIDKYQWDYTNTGLSFQFLIKPSLSVGVGVKGVASVCLRGEIKLTYFIGVTYRGKLDKKKYPLPHRIATYAFKAEVIIEFLLFTRKWTLWEKKNDNWFNNWGKGVSAQGEDVVAQGLAGESLDEFLANMNPVSDAMLRASREFESGEGNGGIVPQGEGDDLVPQGEDEVAVTSRAATEVAPPAPVVTGEYRDDVFAGPDGKSIPCYVYTVTLPTGQAAPEIRDSAKDKAGNAAGNTVDTSARTPEVEMLNEEQVTQVELEPTAEEAAPQTSAGAGPQTSAMTSAVETEMQDESGVVTQTEMQVESGIAAQVEGGLTVQGEVEPTPAAPVVASTSESTQTRAEAPAQASSDQDESLAPQADSAEESGSSSVQTVATEPVAYAIPSYRPLWDHDVSSSISTASEDGIFVASIGDDPGVAGIDTGGGVRPNLDVRMFNEPIYGNPRVQMVKVHDEVIALRIGSVIVDGEPRTRLIATVISGSRRPSGRSQVLDFPLAMTADVAGNYRRSELYDYEFAGTGTALEKWDGTQGKTLYRHCLQVVVVSGKRQNASAISDVASDLVFSFIQFNHNDSNGGDPFTSIFSYVSWPGAKVYPDGNGYEYHCISNVHFEHTMDPNHNNTEYVFYLDRAAHAEEEVLDERASVRLGIMIVRHKTDDTTFTCRHPPQNRILEMMGPSNIDPTAYEMVFWPTVEGFRYFMIRGLNKTSYFSIFLTADGIYEDGICCFASTEGGEVLRYWKAAESDLTLLKYKTPKCLCCRADGRLASAHVKNPFSTSSDNLTIEEIGPADFGASSFGVWGDFVYWPTSRMVEEGEGVDVDEYGEVSEATANYEYRIMAARLWKGKFSDPFILANLDHRMDNIVSVSGTSAALTVVSSEILDVENNTGTMWYTSVPFVRTATIIAAECEMPFVVPGGIAEFFVTIRNDGNTYIKGCVVQMYDEAEKDKGDEWEPCAFAQVGFEYELVSSVYNPPDADGNPTGAEEDGALAPGKIGVYRTLMMVPMEWEGSHKITFVGTYAFYDFVEDNGVKAAADEASESNVVQYAVKPGEIPMDVLTVRASHTDPSVMNDAPVSVVGKAGDQVGASWGGPSAGQSGSSASGESRSAIPRTGDPSSTALAGGLAAAGAAALVYERRRARNEAKGDEDSDA